MHLTDCFIELFACVTRFLKGVETRQPPFDQVRETIVRLLAQSESNADPGQFSREDLDLARFAVCAWVDEMLLSSPWEQRHLWLREQLQRTYFNTTDAGEEFFERLNGLGLHQREVREVYFLCLALGFTGRFCKPGDEYQLEQLKTAQLKLLVGSSVGLPSLERTELFPEAWPAEPPPAAQFERRRGGTLFTAAAVATPVLLFLVLFLVYRFTLAGVGENFLRTVPY